MYKTIHRKQQLQMTTTELQATDLRQIYTECGMVKLF